MPHKRQWTPHRCLRQTHYLSRDPSMSLESANVRLALGRRVAFHVFNATPTRMVVLDGHSMVCAIPIMACAKSSHRLSAWTRLITPLRQHRLMEIVGCTRIGFAGFARNILARIHIDYGKGFEFNSNVADAIAVQSIFSKFCWSGEEGSAYYDGYKGFTVPQTFDNAVLLRKPNAATNLQGAVYLPVFSQILYLDSEIDYSKRFDRLVNLCLGHRLFKRVPERCARGHPMRCFRAISS